MKIILEGDFTISDETGQKARAGPGDVFNFPKGAKIHFETEGGGLAFFVGAVSPCFLLHWHFGRWGHVERHSGAKSRTLVGFD